MDGPSGMGLAALALARRGFHVFPIRAGTKSRHRGGWKELATDDPVLIAEHWRRWPEDNVGVATEPSGLVVIDLDTKKGKDGPRTLEMLELEHGPLPPTLTAKTPSGGVHIYLRVSEPVKSTVEQLGNGVDTRGKGGYVLAPPSQIGGDHYRWDEDGPQEVAEAPEWLVLEVGRPVAVDPEREKPAAELDTEYNLARAKRFLTQDAAPAVEGEGGNALTYVVACGARDLGVSRDECLRLMAEHYSPRCMPPWDDDELAEVVDHAYRYASNRAGVSSPDADFPDDGEVGGEPEVERSGVYDDYIWVAIPQWFVRRSDGKRLSKQAMDSLYDHTVEGAKHFSDTVFKSHGRMRKFVGLNFRPAAPEFLGEDYNLWKNTGCKASDGDASFFVDHVRWMCGEEADKALDFLAHLVQRRGEKMSYSLMIQGGQGLGKSFLGTVMRRILGHTNVEFPTNEELHSNFTEWALGRELVVIQELMAAGRQQMANKLKPLITEDYVRVEEKHKTPYTVENHMNFLIFTNHEDPIPLEHDDRRFLVIMSKADPRGQDYYDSIWDRLLFEGGDEAAHGWLLKRDLSRFNAKGRAPATEAKEMMRRAGLHEVETYLLDLADEERAPFDCDLVAANDLIDCLPDRLKRVPRLYNIVGRFLRQEVRARNLGQHRTAGGASRKVLWSLRRHEIMKGMTPGHRAKVYDRARLGAEFGPDEAEEDVLA